MRRFGGEAIAHVDRYALQERPLQLHQADGRDRRELLQDKRAAAGECARLRLVLDDANVE
jgi:hypothetical protein